MKILTKNNKIIAISKIADIVSNGIKLDNYILGISVGQDGQFSEELPKIYDVETVPPEVIEEKYCYTEEKGFYSNNESNESKDLKDEISSLKKQVDEQSKKLSEQNEAMAEMMNLIAMQGITPTK
ncbi:hypothetical protein [Clostridium sporogenes]|uniref:hypothetical protein n=1 Tax=Clostridium sporogenes TaxID=1509 RepID=UPI00024BA465|nr:hypothetical protein [Clostridium sporogenes]EHN17010.1 hypothetical protein IYC_00492 [Clostridium sporogenes PA 3679]NFQ35973.1 hypothetical protein [Clostridium sporogenes]NFQ60567.1 hypothetical protein [Clostridium sporogenes]NFU11128.1 hypothetical protein [Clostridium sporogenes]NFU43922.1 hypothetical protein [Clostridium sporogenes]